MNDLFFKKPMVFLLFVLFNQSCSKAETEKASTIESSLPKNIVQFFEEQIKAMALFVDDSHFTRVDNSKLYQWQKCRVQGERQEITEPEKLNGFTEVYTVQLVATTERAFDPKTALWSEWHGSPGGNVKIYGYIAVKNGELVSGEVYHPFWKNVALSLGSESAKAPTKEEVQSALSKIISSQ